MSLLPEGKENNVEVIWDDQKKINQFSTLIQQKDLITAQLKVHQQEKEYFADVVSELEMLELEDDDELGSDLDDDDEEADESKNKSSLEYNDKEKKVQYKIGDTLVYMSYSEANERAQRDNEINDKAIDALNEQLAEVETKVQELKTQLYAKFGNNINLERD